MVGIRYHGNDCGPGWSAGKYQASVATSSLPPVDPFDQTCRDHDAEYANHRNLDIADTLFVKANWGKGVKRSAAAAAVWLNSTARILYYGADPTTNDEFVEPEPVVMGVKRAARSSTPSFAPPTIVGTGIRLSEPVVVNTKSGIVVTGSEMIPSTKTNIYTSAWDIVSIFRLSPVHYGSGRLGRFAQLYEEFKWLRGSVAYVTAVGTSTLGNIIMEYQSNSAEPCRHYGGNNFLQNVMTSGNGTLMPIWKNFTLELPINDTKFHPIGSDLTYPDQNDASAGDVYVYDRTAVASQDPGFYILNYSIEFRGATLNPRLSSIPYPTGTLTQNWSSQTIIGTYLLSGATTATPVNKDALHWACASGSSAFEPDTVYKVIMCGVNSGTNNVTVGGVAKTVPQYLYSATKRGYTLLPNFGNDDYWGYTLYMATGQLPGTPTAFGGAVGTMYTSIQGAMANSDTPELAGAGGTTYQLADLNKDVLVLDTAGANTAFTFGLNVWMIPIAQSQLLQQSNV